MVQKLSLHYQHLVLFLLFNHYCSCFKIVVILPFKSVLSSSPGAILHGSKAGWRWFWDGLHGSGDLLFCFLVFFLGEYRDWFPEENQQRDVCCQAPEAHQARRRGLRQERAGDLEQGELGHKSPVEIIQGEDEGVQSHPWPRGVLRVGLAERHLDRVPGGKNPVISTLLTVYLEGGDCYCYCYWPSTWR